MEYEQGEKKCISIEYPQTLLETIRKKPEFETFSKLIDMSGLASKMSKKEKKYTIFAPTNEAFASFFYDYGTTLDEMLVEKDLLVSVLEYLVLPQVVEYKKLGMGEMYRTLLDNNMEGEYSLEVTFDYKTHNNRQEKNLIKNVLGDATWATVVRYNLWSCNGVIHAIDYVLLPDCLVKKWDKKRDPAEDEDDRRKLNQFLNLNGFQRAVGDK